MAITVTATQGGSTANGFALRVFVLTGAKAVASQTGAAVNQQVSASNTWTQSITTTAGSNVYGAGAPFVSGLTLTGSNATIVDQINDATNGAVYGTWHALNVTGGATARGFTTTNTPTGPMAMLEILASGTLAEDSSGTGVVNSTTGAGPVTTPSFTPPPGSLLVALIASDGGAGVTTFTVSDTGGGLNWTEKSKNNPSGGDYAGVWIADVPGGGTLNPRPVPVPPGRQSPMAFQWIPQVPVFTFPPAPLPLVMPHLVIASRRTARAVTGFAPVRTTNGGAVAAGPTVMLAGGFISSRRPAGGIWGGIGTLTVNAAVPPPNGTVPDHLVIARRSSSRAYVRFNPVETVNGPPYSFTEVLVRIAQRVPHRAFVQFKQVRTTNAAPSGINGTAPDHLVVARRSSARAFWRGTVAVTANLPQGNQPGGLVRRRSTARAVVHGNTVPLAPNGAVQDHLIIARRTAARAVITFTPVETVNAAPGTLNGTAPDHLVIARRAMARAFVRGTVSRTVNLPQGNPPGGLIRRRTAARAVVRGTVSATVNQAAVQPVNGTVPDHLVVARRTAARAVWRPTGTETVNLQNGNQPGGLIRRRRPAGAYWRPTGTETVNRPPNIPGTGGLVKRRGKARGQWAGRVARTTNQPPPPFFVARSISTVSEVAGMNATVTGTPNKATMTEVAGCIPTVT